MDDFNAAMSSLENGIGRAQETAEIAKAKAETLPYVIGHYRGTFGSQKIELGFRPSLVFISVIHNNSDPSGTAYFACFQSGSEGLSFQPNGFEVPFEIGGNYPSLNAQNSTYLYIAFR